MNRRQFLSTTAAAAAAFPSGVAFAADERRWRIGVLGHTGRGNFGHGLHTLWMGLPETELVGLADPDDAGRAAAQKAAGNPPAFADYHEMLAQVQPDIVVVAPRHVDQHREMAVAAAQAGAKGIYCEKPFCSTLAEADAIVAACRDAGTKLALAHRNRYHPAVPVAQQALADGTIGDLLEVRCRGREDHRGGVEDMWVLGTHVLDMLRAFCGDARACSAVLLQDHQPANAEDVTPGAEGLGPFCGDEVHARYEMDSGAVAYFDSIRNRVDPEANFGLQFIGTKGMIDCRIDTEPLFHLVAGNPFLPARQPRPWTPISSAGIGVAEPIDGLERLVEFHVYAARDLLAAIKEDRPALSSETDGRAIVEMIHAALGSHVRNGERVAIPLANRGHALDAWKDG